MVSTASSMRRLPTCVTPLRSMRKRRMVQLPLAIALSMPALIISVCSERAASKLPARLLLLSVLSACAACSHLA